jgi:hypothetical protein
VHDTLDKSPTYFPLRSSAVPPLCVCGVRVKPWRKLVGVFLWIEPQELFVVAINTISYYNYLHGTNLYYYIRIGRRSYNAFGERDWDHFFHPIIFNISTSTSTVRLKQNHCFPSCTTLLPNCQIRRDYCFPNSLKT